MSDSLPTQLPDNVLDFLSDVEAVRFAEKFVKTYGLKQEDVPDIMSLAEDLVYRDVRFESLPEEMVARFGIDSAKSKQAALEMAEARLLPVKEVVPGIAQQIRAWGGEVALGTLAEDAVISPAVFVQTSLQDILKEMPAEFQARLAHILELYVSKHSSVELVTEMLMKSEKVGGLEFEQEDVDRLLKYVDEKMQWKRIGEPAVLQAPIAVKKPVVTATPPVQEQEKKKNLVTEAPKPVAKIELAEMPKKVEAPIIIVENKPEPVQKPIIPVVVPIAVPVVPSVKPDHLMEADVHEIEQVKTAKQSAMETPIAAPNSIEEMVGQICSLEPMQLPDGTLSDRCRQIVDSRLREVRTAADTQKQLERSVETGGLGVTGRKLADMMQAIEQAFDVFMKHASEKAAQDKTVYLEKQKTAEVEKQTLSEKEEKMMTKRYVELTGKMPDAHVTPVGPASARVSAAVAQDAMLATKEQNIDTQKVRGVIEATKKQTESVPAPVFKQSVQDVKFVKRLSGPIDELGALSLIDFRRMAKNAEQSAERILDLVHLVEDQGYDKRVEAIRAWQSSPLYQSYLVIARTAMQEGKPLEDMRAEIAKTKETLTEQELAIVLKLNSELRF